LLLDYYYDDDYYYCYSELFSIFSVSKPSRLATKYAAECHLIPSFGIKVLTSFLDTSSTSIARVISE
jgi:hypothetical protein